MKHQTDLDRAIATHQAGRLPEAASMYRDLLLADPHHADALHLLGVLMQQIGQPQTAVELISRAVAIAPSCAMYHLNLGNAQLASGDKNGAVGSYRTAAACDPRCLDAHINLGNVAMGEQRYAEAAESYARAVASDPKCRDALMLLGVACIESGDTERADRALSAALEVDPAHALAHMFRGYARARAGDYAGSLAFYRKAVRLDPLRDEAYNNLGAAYEGLGRYEEAAPAFAKAFALRPASVEYLVNVGLNMARRKDKGGIAYLERAVALMPDHAIAHSTLGEVLLAFGEYERGWQEDDWRWKRPDLKADRNFPQPRWDGGRFDGKTLLLHADHGYGDTVQFLRFVEQAAGLGGTIVLEVQPPLYRLFAGLPGADRCLRQGIDPLPEFDIHCPVMSLPLALGTTLATIPASVRIPAFPASRPSSRHLSRKIGLVWGGNPEHVRNVFRSMPLKALAALRGLPDTVFVCLQKVVARDDRDAVRAFPMECPLTPDGDYLETAEVIDRLDLLLCVDTSVAHLAASMGKPVWLLLPEAADWRWGVEGERTAWYPSMTLFRQRREGDWTELVKRVAARLRTERLPPDTPPPAQLAHAVGERTGPPTGVVRTGTSVTVNPESIPAPA